MHGVLQQDTQESLKCLNKHIPHQLGKGKKKSWFHKNTQSSEPVQWAGMSVCIPEAQDSTNTSFQPNRP